MGHETAEVRGGTPASEELLPDPDEEALVPVWPNAGKALKCGRSQTFRLAAKGKFPVEVLKFGNRFYVRNVDLRRYLGMRLRRP
jgi:hypothetical protein